jgi:hypothetical protein
MELTTAAGLGLSVDEHYLGLEQLARLAARIDHVGKLEQLAQSDHVSADRYAPALHVDSVAPR